MGWSTGSEVADALWDKISKDIPKSKWVKVAKIIVSVMEDFDCDTIEETEVYNVASKTFNYE